MHWLIIGPSLDISMSTDVPFMPIVGVRYLESSVCTKAQCWLLPFTFITDSSYCSITLFHLATSHNIANPIPIITTCSPLGALSVYKLIQCCTNSLLTSLSVPVSMVSFTGVWTCTSHTPVIFILIITPLLMHLHFSSSALSLPVSPLPICSLHLCSSFCHWCVQYLYIASLIHRLHLMLSITFIWLIEFWVCISKIDSLSLFLIDLTFHIRTIL